MRLTSLLCILVPCIGHAQEWDEAILQQGAELHEHEAQTEATAIFTEHWQRHPLDINKADELELLQFPFWTVEVVHGILAHRQLYGSFYHLNELLQVPGISREQLLFLEPLILITRKAWKMPKHLLVYALQQSSPASSGQLDGVYQGGPAKINGRYTYVGNSMEAGIRFEKDAGERWLSNHRPEYLSAYVQWKGMGLIRSVLLGDYDLAYGEGLGLYTANQYGARTGIESIRANSLGSGPHRSNNETDLLRGVLMCLARNKLSLDLFFSHRRLDGSLDEAGRISSLHVTGYHRTPGELATRHTIQVRQWGGALRHKRENAEIGMYFSQREYKHPWSNNQVLHRLFTSNRSRENQLGIHTSLSHGASMWLAEYSTGLHRRSEAFTAGWIHNLANEIDISLHYRFYGRSSNTMQSNGLSRASDPAGEEGLSMSWRYQRPPWMLLLSWDQSRDLWLRYLRRQLEWNNSVRLSLNYQPKRSRKMQFIWHRRSTQDDMGPLLRKPNTYLHAVRLHMDHHIGKTIRLRWRGEFRWLQDRPSVSVLMYQEVKYSPSESPWQFQFRIAQASVPNYHLRVYAYKPVIYGQYPMIIYSQTGWYANWVMRWKYQDVKLWASYDVQLHFPKRIHWNETYQIGSGSESRLGRIKHTFALQFAYEL